MRALRLLLALATTLATTQAFPWKRHTSAAAIHRRKRRFVRGGAWGFGKNKDSAAEAASQKTVDIPLLRGTTPSRRQCWGLPQGIQT